MFLDRQGDNLIEVALAARFGRYAQFHRVFLASNRMTPGKFLPSRVRRQN